MAHRPPLAETIETADYVRTTAAIYTTDATHVTVVARILPGVGYWTAPDARTRRRIAATTAAAAGRTLAAGVAGRQVTGGPVTQWTYRYDLAPTA